jgi:hypothetical protein
VWVKSTRSFCFRRSQSPMLLAVCLFLVPWSGTHPLAIEVICLAHQGVRQHLVRPVDAPELLSGRGVV